VATITLNGDRHEFAAETTVLALLETMGLGRRGGLAVEVNASVIPRSEHASTILRAGDRVEVVMMMAGG
jgi:sulfur carrier protein